MNNIFRPVLHQNSDSTRASAALLLLRLIVGVALVAHGFGKIQNPFGWMGPDSSIPGFFLALSALAEFGGGIALILGILTPVAALAIVGNMLVAVNFHLSKGDGFLGGYELALVYLVISAALFLTGPGRFSLDAKLQDRKKSRLTGARTAAI